MHAREHTGTSTPTNVDIHWPHVRRAQIYCSAMYGGQFGAYEDVLVDEAQACPPISACAPFCEPGSLACEIFIATSQRRNSPRPLAYATTAQDLSPINHVQLALCGAGRIIAVGDARQAIYAFRGADARSMDKIRGLRPLETWVDLPLHETFRCPRRVVERQALHAPGYKAAPGNRDGRVDSWEGSQWDWAKVEAARLGASPATLDKLASAVARLRAAPKAARKPAGPVAPARAVPVDDPAPGPMQPPAWVLDDE